MRLKSVLAMAATTVALLQGPAWAQSKLRIGETVRFKLDGAPSYQKGMIESVSEDSLTLDVGDRYLTLPLDGPGRIQRKTGTADHPAPGWSSA